MRRGYFSYLGPEAIPKKIPRTTMWNRRKNKIVGRHYGLSCMYFISCIILETKMANQCAHIG